MTVEGGYADIFGPQVPRTAGEGQTATFALASAAYRDTPYEDIKKADNEWHQTDVKEGRKWAKIFRPNLGEAFSSEVVDRMLGSGRKPLISLTLEPGSTVAPAWPFAALVPEQVGKELAQHPDDPRDQLAALITGRNMGHDALAHRLGIGDEVLPFRGPPNHRCQKINEGLPEFKITGSWSGLEHGLKLPGLGPFFVVSAVAGERTHELAGFALGP